MSSVQNQPPQVAAVEQPTPPSGPRPREQFIPLRKAELVEALAGTAGLSATEAAAFRGVCRLVEGLLHREFQAALEDLKNSYAPFDPDADTRAGRELSGAELDLARQKLFQKFSWLLERGNFQRLKQQEIERALEDRTYWGLSLAVDFDVFDRLELYFRGDNIGTRFRRRLAKGFRIRTESVDVPIYQRLVLIFCLRSDRPLSKYLDTRDVHIKLFKDIPQVDIEMLLPGTEAKMSLLDRARIMLPTLSGMSMAVWKILAGGTLLFSLAFLALVGGTVGYGVRSLYGYLNTKQKYQLSLTQSLYYLNLDNNAGVIHRLLDEAEEQENREVALGYFFLWRKGPSVGWTSAELDAEIEAFLATQGVGQVDFEIADALAKLQRLGLVESYSPDKWKAVPIEQAVEVLARAWGVVPT